MRLFVVILVALAMAQARPVQAKHPDYWRPLLKKAQHQPVFRPAVTAALRDLNQIEATIARAETIIAHAAPTVDIIFQLPSGSNSVEAELLAIESAIKTVDILEDRLYRVTGVEAVFTKRFPHSGRSSFTIGTELGNVQQLSAVMAGQYRSQRTFEDSVLVTALRMVVDEIRDHYALARLVVESTTDSVTGRAVLIADARRKVSLLLARYNLGLDGGWYDTGDIELWKKLNTGQAPDWKVRPKAHDTKRSNDL